MTLLFQKSKIEKIVVASLSHGVRTTIHAFIAASAIGFGAIGSLGALDSYGQPLSNGNPTVKFRLVTAGQDHTCGVTTRGRTLCWGSNKDGQLGLGKADNSPHTRPEWLATPLVFRAMTAGYRHTCGLTKAGTAFCWGANDSGQLGNGSLTKGLTPVEVAGRLIFKSLSAGGTHTCGITNSGVTYCWGGNWHGQLGIGTTDGEQRFPCCYTAPVPVEGASAFTQVSTGGIHTCGLTKSGKAFCWGAGSAGRLGIGAGRADVLIPTAVSGSLEFTTLRTRGFFTCGLTRSKTAYCWGSNTQGELGIGSPVEEHDAPAEVHGKIRFTTIEEGNNHTCGLTADGRLHCWGSNRFGQIGNGQTEHRYSPTPVSTQLRFTTVTSGGNDFSGHTCAIATNGRILCWGDNRWGQLGNGSTVAASIPGLVMDPESRPVANNRSRPGF